LKDCQQLHSTPNGSINKFEDIREIVVSLWVIKKAIPTGWPLKNLYIHTI